MFLNRKNVILLLMCVELLLLAANFNFIAFSRYLGDIHGQVFVFFVLTVAAAESAIGLAILVVLFRERRSINVEDLNTLQAERSRMNPRLLTRHRAPAAPRRRARGHFRAPDRARGRAHRDDCGGGRLLRASLYVLKQLYWDGVPTFNGTVYTWLVSDDVHYRRWAS